MREIISKSLKLNRDLGRYVEKALEEDRPVKIGWGQAGDERPKDGEIGVITHLPEGARVLCLGDLGECAGAVNLGGTFTLRGSSASMLGAFHVEGLTVVERDAGSKAGYRMRGGNITIQGSVADESGAGMSGGKLVIRGHAGSRLGAGMSEGSIVVMGSVGSDPGVGMRGGRILVSGSCPPPGEGVLMRSIKKGEISEFSKLLEPMGLNLNEDVLVLEATEKLPVKDDPTEKFIAEGFERIALSSNDGPLAEHCPLDHYTLIVSEGTESEGLLLPIPWIISCESAAGLKGALSEKQPAIVRSEPRKIDLLRIGEDNLAESVSDLGDCAGIVFDLVEFPGLNDAEIEGLLVSLFSRMDDSALVFLRGGIDKIEHVFRLVVELEIDGAIIDCSTSGGSRLASALPRIGLSSKAMGLSERGKIVLMEIDRPPTSKDLLISVAAGCQALVSPAPEDLEDCFEGVLGNLRSWMRELGIDGIDRIGRRNLRAMDYDTAAVSGIRLAGYDRPLPMWLDLR